RLATIASRCNASIREESATGGLRESRLTLLLEYATPNLVQLDRFEERPEIAFAEALIALALDDLEEDRPDDCRGEDLQQHLVGDRRAVDQDTVFLQARAVLLVSGQTLRQQIVIGFRRVLERHAPSAQQLHGRVDVVGAERDVLDALAVV